MRATRAPFVLRRERRTFRRPARRLNRAATLAWFALGKRHARFGAFAHCGTCIFRSDGTQRIRNTTNQPSPRRRCRNSYATRSRGPPPCVRAVIRQAVQIVIRYKIQYRRRVDFNVVVESIGWDSIVGPQEMLASPG